MQDNSDLQQKLRLRQKALGGERPGLVLDAFAGEGTITSMFWRHLSERVICLEQLADKAGKIVSSGNVQVVCGDNRDYVHLARDADVVDCDAHGLVMPYINLLSGYAPPGALIVFTDGSPTKKHKVTAANGMFYSEVKRMFSDWHVELNISKTAFYGYGYLK